MSLPFAICQRQDTCRRRLSTIRALSLSSLLHCCPALPGCSHVTCNGVDRVVFSTEKSILPSCLKENNVVLHWTRQLCVQGDNWLSIPSLVAGEVMLFFNFISPSEVFTEPKKSNSKLLHLPSSIAQDNTTSWRAWRGWSSSVQSLSPGRRCPAQTALRLDPQDHEKLKWPSLLALKRVARRTLAILGQVKWSWRRS